MLISLTSCLAATGDVNVPLLIPKQNFNLPCIAILRKKSDSRYFFVPALPDPQNGSKEKFALLFLRREISSLPSHKYRLIYICRQETRPEIRPSNVPKNPSRGKKIVTFSCIDDLVSAAPLTTQEERWRVEGVCELIHTAANLTSRRLHLIVDDHTLWHSNASLDTDRIQKEDPVSLEDAMRLHSPLSFAKRRTRSILQVTLANALLQLYEGPWIMKDLSKAHICFYAGKDQGSPDFTKPYLSTDCKSPECIEQDHEVSRFRIHPYPSILALGILLLELELGVPIEAKRSQDNPNNGQRFQNIDADRPVAQEMLYDCEEESSEDFIEAVDACLNDKTFTDTFGRNATFNNIEFREQIYARIVKPLEDAFENIYKIPVEMLDTISSALPRTSKLSSRYDNVTPLAAISPVRFGRCLKPAATTNCHVLSLELSPSMNHAQNFVSLFYDDIEHIGIADLQQ
jgi:hypothetical protein